MLMKIFGRAFAIILAATAIVSAVSALFLYNFEQQAFNPQFYKSILAEQHAYERIYLIMPQGQVEGENNSRPNPCAGMAGNSAPPTPTISAAIEPVILNFPTEEGWKEAFSPPEVQALTEDALDQFFGFLEGKKASPCVSLDPIKENLRRLGEEYEPAAASVPDQFSPLPWDSTSMEELVEAIRYARLAMRLSPLIPLLSLLLMTAFIIRKQDELMGWWGFPLLTTGLLTIGLGLLGSHWLVGFMDTLLLRNTSPSYKPEMHQLTMDLISGALGWLINPIYIQSAVLGVAGLMLMVWAHTLRKRKDL